MYIKEIKINGFKSFADKTTIELDKSFTGIVGPNGSGKSNIVDAVKWVLGEQSIKALRGASNMSDVIFSGSVSRNPSNFASVSILFDNSDRGLNIDYNEVEIKRVVYRTGENEYLINNEKCRLKDITNLLIDTMSSKESFNIVPQKKVDQILSEKPEDRRIIFEDAAGVLKYKGRKLECLRKLDRTHDNMSRVDMIINEISENLPTLEKESIKAREYKNAFSELEKIEVALIVKDITNFSELLKTKEGQKQNLENELTKINTSSSSESTEVEKLKSKIMHIDEELMKSSEELISVNKAIIEASNKKALMSERNKYDKNSDEIKNNLVNLKDKEGKIESSVNNINIDINNLGKEKDNIFNKITSLSRELSDIEIITSSFNEKYNKKNITKIEINSKIDILNNNINNLSKVPYSVRSILETPVLRGIHNILAALIETKSEYSTMLDVALGYSANNIIVEDEVCAKEAIEYLKSHNKGRVTFFPLNIIKPRSIDPNILAKVKSHPGFIDVASNLVKYDSKYYNIIMNQLGNIIVASNLKDAQSISKKINHLYRVVTLDGEILHIGGSITGGSIKANTSYISDRYELDKLSINIKALNEELVNLEKDIKENEEKIKKIKNQIFELNISLANISESINSKKTLLEENEKALKLVKEEINSLSTHSEALDKELNDIIEKYYNLENKKHEYEKKQELLNKEKLDLNKDLIVLESSIKKMNKDELSISNNIHTLDIDITKLNSSLDNLLNRLNIDYSMTYEKAKNNYILETDEKEARDKVNSLRRTIKSLGEVNLGSIEEYERISNRVGFLSKQKEDLIKSKEDLLKIIDEMDNIMIDKFKTTFDKINIEFNNVFKSLFKGGEAHLELTDPDNILETGINIIAVPSGKTLKPISLLSGGEKTLTAISLLFAIMNLKNVPFVILDEVESDLDDSNVTIFCEYLKSYKNKTQLLVITHKKKTMEYLDVLYGVTMQESGVSKLVSVKLEN